MPNQETQLQIISQCEHFLNNLSENDLRLLNRMVVERLNLYRKAKDLNSLAKFNKTISRVAEAEIKSLF